MINILLVDDQAIIRNGLKSILSHHYEISIVGEAENGKDAYFLAFQLKPDLILMDVRMPVMDGVEATKIIKSEFPNIKILMLTTFDDDQYIIQAMNYGASGYLLKDIDIERLKNAIIDAMHDHVILPGQIAKKLFTHLPTIDHHLSKNDFTPRELDIIKHLIQGKTNQEISDLLYLSLGTVKNYMSTIYTKLDVTDRSNAIIQLKRIGF